MIKWNTSMDWARGKMTRRTRTSARPIEEEGGGSMYMSEGDVCFSGQVWRQKHEYLIDSPEGTRCIYCRTLCRMEPMP